MFAGDEDPVGNLITALMESSTDGRGQPSTALHQCNQEWAARTMEAGGALFGTDGEDDGATTSETGTAEPQKQS
jgi:hypothetical protein